MDNEEFTQPTDKGIEVVKKVFRLNYSIYKKVKKIAKKREQRAREQRGTNSRFSSKDRDFSARSRRSRSLKQAIQMARNKASLENRQPKKALDLSRTSPGSRGL